MIRSTRNRLLILVAVLALARCKPPAAGSEPAARTTGAAGFVCASSLSLLWDHGDGGCGDRAVLCIPTAIILHACRFIPIASSAEWFAHSGKPS